MLSRSYKEGWFFAVSHIQEHKRVGNFLIILQYRAQVKFNTVKFRRITLYHGEELEGAWNQKEKVHSNLSAIALDQDRNTQHIEKQMDCKDIQNIEKIGRSILLDLLTWFFFSLQEVLWITLF